MNRQIYSSCLISRASLIIPAGAFKKCENRVHMATTGSDSARVHGLVLDTWRDKWNGYCEIRYITWNYALVVRWIFQCTARLERSTCRQECCCLVFNSIKKCAAGRFVRFVRFVHKKLHTLVIFCINCITRPDTKQLHPPVSNIEITTWDRC